MPLSTILLVLLSAIIHASWNLIIRSRNLSRQFLRIPLLIGIIGLPPVLWLEWHGRALPGVVWGLLVVTGLFQACYYLGLAMGYQSGDFTVVYPLVRALPVLFIGLFDFLRGHAPSGVAWIGMILVAMGCLIIPHTTWRTLRWRAYGNRTILWVVVAALGTVGYSAADKLAAEFVTPGAVDAARYFVLELIFCMPPFAVALRLMGQPIGLQPWRHGWGWPLLAACGTFLSYWLILWAYQGTDHASYVVAIRQISIVIGTILGTMLFQEPARGLRIPAAMLITTGIIMVALGG